MFEIMAKAFVFALATYVGLGLIFAVPFVWVGVQRLDREARETKLGFRLLILPGAAVFWPMFLYRWSRGFAVPPLENDPHDD